MTSPAVIEGASVAELLDQASDRLYNLAAGTPSARELCAAWPAYAAACARLIEAATGPRFPGLRAVAVRADTDAVLIAGLRLHAHLATRAIAPGTAVPDATLTRAAQLVGAATDLLECAHDRSGTTGRDLAQTDDARTAGITGAAELVAAGADVVLRSARRPRLHSNAGELDLPTHIVARVAPLLTTRRLAGTVLDAAAGRASPTVLDAIRVPTLDLIDPSDLLGRFQVAAADWRRASLDAAHAAAPSGAEFLRTTIEARQIIALTAALTDAAAATGLLTPNRAANDQARLRRAATAWAAATTAWTRLTTGVPPSRAHIDASLILQTAIRAITRDDTGAWLTPETLAHRVDLPSALSAAGKALGDVADVGRAHAETLKHLCLAGGLYAHASAVPITDDRVAARISGRFVPVTLGEVQHLHDSYRAAAAGARRPSPSTPIRHFAAADAEARVASDIRLGRTRGSSQAQLIR